MSNEPYIGTDPIYQNHANEVDAPLASEDDDVAELEERAAQYEADMVKEPIRAPHPNGEQAAEDEDDDGKSSEPDETWTKAEIQEHLDAAGTPWTPPR